jgi:hypothetical protein
VRLIDTSAPPAKSESSYCPRTWQRRRRQAPARSSDRAASYDRRGRRHLRGPARFSTCGSVDDGKSLIGRLLYDTKSIFEDQAHVEDGAAGATSTNLALLTDGLRAEREQGITIDVAYRYFATPRASSSSPTRRGTSSTRATW